MLLRKTIVAESPCLEDSPTPSFMVSEVENRKQEIYDAAGVLVSEQIIEVPVQKVIPASDFENKGLKAELFSVENKKAAGVDVFGQKPMTSPFYRNSLDAIGDGIDTLNETDFEQIIDETND